MPVFVDALLGDTMHLTADEFGAYCLILFATWRHGGQALPDDDRVLSRICRVTPTRWRRTLRPRLLSFFDVKDGKFHQKRLEKEWEYLSNLREKNRAGGKASALKRKERQATTVPAELQPNGNPYTYIEGKKEPNGSSFPSLSIDPNGSISLTAAAARLIKSDFDQFWKAYPKKVGKNAALRKYEIARRSATAEDLLAGVRRYVGSVAGTDKQFVVHPAAWLHQGRWKDEDDDQPLHDGPTEPPPKPEDLEWPEETRH